MKFFLKVFLLIICIAIISKCWILYSCNFRIDKIKPRYAFENQNFFEVDDCLGEILNQDFKFLNKGRHTFVFISEDEKYIIKFFRFHRYNLPICLYLFKSFPFFHRIYEKIKREIDISYKETMDSYKLAYEKLQNETAIMYLHLNNNKLNRKLRIIDKFNINYRVDLDDTGFLIQKKAKSFSNELLKVKNDIKALEHIIASFFLNLESIYKKGIVNNDRHILSNLGILDNEVIEIDVGRFKLNEKIYKKDILEKEINHYTVFLRKWLSKNIPQALPILDSQIEKLIKSANR